MVEVFPKAKEFIIHQDIVKEDGNLDTEGVVGRGEVRLSLSNEPSPPTILRDLA